LSFRPHKIPTLAGQTQQTFFVVARRRTSVARLITTPKIALGSLLSSGPAGHRPPAAISLAVGLAVFGRENNTAASTQTLAPDQLEASLTRLTSTIGRWRGIHQWVASEPVHGDGWHAIDGFRESSRESTRSSTWTAST